MKQLIAQGAEAKIYREDSKVIKDRIKKNYRLAEIDEQLRKQRTNSEYNLLITAERAGVPVPNVLNKDKNILEIEFIDGQKVRDYLDNEKDAKKRESICKQIGESVQKMHKYNITHGDLTTSNMILKASKVFFIDFGLGAISDRDEDKAVDLHLLKECMVSKHHAIWKSCWEAFLKGYQNKSVLERLEIVESRGKYKERD